MPRDIGVVILVVVVSLVLLYIRAENVHWQGQRTIDWRSPRAIDRPLDEPSNGMRAKPTGTQRNLLLDFVWPCLVPTCDLLPIGVALIITSTEAAGEILIALSVSAISMKVAGLYNSRLTLSVLDDLPRLLIASLPPSLVCTAIDTARVPSSLTQSWMPLVTVYATILGAVVLGRFLCYSLLRLLRRRGWVLAPTVIIGASTVGWKIADRLNTNPEYGLKAIGFIDNQLALGNPPTLGTVDSLRRALSGHEVRAVVIAFASGEDRELVNLIREFDRRTDIEVFVVPRLFELNPTSAGMSHIGSIPLVRLRRASHRSFSWPAKRVFDIIASASALLLLSPLMAAIAIAISVEGGPGILFRQTRVGIDGHHFQLLKFRTLRLYDEAVPRSIPPGAGRIGPVGRFLRRTSLDELPQLLNILRGEMSLVGPRPERPHFVEQFEQTYPAYRARNRVPCGLVGWAQLQHMDGAESIANRALADNYYIENWSFWLDIKIIAKSVPAAFRRTS